MVKFPSDEAIDRAIAWLYVNEGDGGEALDCKAVADALSALKMDRFIKQEAREAGVSVAAVRRAMASQ